MYSFKLGEDSDEEGANQLKTGWSSDEEDDRFILCVCVHAYSFNLYKHAPRHTVDTYILHYIHSYRLLLYHLQSGSQRRSPGIAQGRRRSAYEQRFAITMTTCFWPATMTTTSSAASRWVGSVLAISWLAYMKCMYVWNNRPR